MSDSSSTGVNLQRASVVILFDTPWTMAVQDQIIGRVWRVNQPRPVEAFALVTAGTIEGWMRKTATVKGELAQVLNNDAVTRVESSAETETDVAELEELEDTPSPERMRDPTPPLPRGPVELPTAEEPTAERAEVLDTLAQYTTCRPDGLPRLPLGTRVLDPDVPMRRTLFDEAVARLPFYRLSHQNPARRHFLSRAHGRLVDPYTPVHTKFASVYADLADFPLANPLPATEEACESLKIVAELFTLVKYNAYPCFWNRDVDMHAPHKPLASPLERTASQRQWAANTDFSNKMCLLANRARDRDDISLAEVKALQEVVGLIDVSDITDNAAELSRAHALLLDGFLDINGRPAVPDTAPRLVSGEPLFRKMFTPEETESFNTLVSSMLSPDTRTPTAEEVDMFQAWSLPQVSRVKAKQATFMARPAKPTRKRPSQPVVTSQEDDRPLAGEERDDRVEPTQRLSSTQLGSSELAAPRSATTISRTAPEARTPLGTFKRIIAPLPGPSAKKRKLMPVSTVDL